MAKSAFIGGALSFKGDKKKAKKKTKKSKHKEKKRDEEYETEEMTEAEKRALKYKLQRERQESEKIAQKSHRERVEELNEKLGSLTEHNDIPRSLTMSHRAIQRLRQEREEIPLVPPESLSESDEEDERPNRTTAFASMMDSSSEESSSSGDDTSIDDQSALDDKGDHRDDSLDNDAENIPNLTQDVKEDLDALLEEFKMQDKVPENAKQPNADESFAWFETITSGINLRDLDFDSVMRTSLLGNGDGASAIRSNRRSRQYIFGPPKDGWPRPPRYVGGGIGMTSYDNESRLLPWPYCDMKEGDDRCPVNERCYTMLLSDSYLRDCEDYERVKASGDANMLALFCAHHPFSIESLLQLSAVLYQTSQSQEGRSLLQRALWVWECSFLNSFIKKNFGFMDFGQSENAPFFETLFRMVRISHVAGLPRAALAYSKLLLSLDPLRDPMNVLLIIDHFVLLSNTHEDDLWLVSFFESKKVAIFYKEEESEYECYLESMPNWAYSYALALYRINQKEPSPETEVKAKHAMKKAIASFPSIFEKLLVANEVDIRDQSFQTALEYANNRSEILSNQSSDDDIVMRSRISQVCELITRIFVSANFKIWSSNVLHMFMAGTMHELASVESISLQPALLRYASIDPTNFEDRFQTMPAEANPLDRNLVNHAIRVDTNRPRFMQRMPRNGGAGGEELELGGNQSLFAGPPTERIDPDWPLLEIFWRSALPWTYVDGVRSLR